MFYAVVVITADLGTHVERERARHCLPVCLYVGGANAWGNYTSFRCVEWHSCTLSPEEMVCVPHCQVTCNLTIAILPHVFTCSHTRQPDSISLLVVMKLGMKVKPLDVTVIHSVRSLHEV
jgi:hypothetical protein